MPRVQREARRKRVVALHLAFAKPVPQVHPQVAPLAVEHGLDDLRLGGRQLELDPRRSQLVRLENLECVRLADKEPRSQGIAEHGVAELGAVGEDRRGHRRNGGRCPGDLLDEARKLCQRQRAAPAPQRLGHLSLGDPETQPVQRHVDVANRGHRIAACARRLRKVRRDIGNESPELGELQPARLVCVVTPDDCVGLLARRIEPELRERLTQAAAWDRQRSLGGLRGEQALYHTPKFAERELGVRVAVVLAKQLLRVRAGRHEEEVPEGAAELGPGQRPRAVAVKVAKGLLDGVYVDRDW